MFFAITFYQVFKISAIFFFNVGVFLPTPTFIIEPKYAYISVFFYLKNLIKNVKYIIKVEK